MNTEEVYSKVRNGLVYSVMAVPFIVLGAVGIHDYNLPVREITNVKITKIEREFIPSEVGPAARYRKFYSEGNLPIIFLEKDSLKLSVGDTIDAKVKDSVMTRYGGLGGLKGLSFEAAKSPAK